MTFFLYRRENAVAYARRWAHSRNPRYYDFVGLGGDCTNFISQCVYAGACQMNYRPTFGWYYISPDERSPSWTGVEIFYEFLIRNEGPGPFAAETEESALQPGDVVQLGNKGGDFYHTLLVTERSSEGILVAAHTYDALDRPLSSYEYAKLRCLHIEGVRAEVRPKPCFI